ncbi:hypothetical protein Chor_001604 [Crotalus horridus]
MLGLLPVLQSSGSDTPMEITRQPSLVTEGITSSPPVPPESPSDSGRPKNVSTDGHGKHRKVFPVLDFQYKYVHLPFEITLWILLACLMKLDWTVLGVSAKQAEASISLRSGKAAIQLQPKEGSQQDLLIGFIWFIDHLSPEGL